MPKKRIWKTRIDLDQCIVIAECLGAVNSAHNTGRPSSNTLELLKHGEKVLNNSDLWDSLPETLKDEPKASVKRNLKGALDACTAN